MAGSLPERREIRPDSGQQAVDGDDGGNDDDDDGDDGDDGDGGDGDTINNCSQHLCLYTDLTGGHP